MLNRGCYQTQSSTVDGSWTTCSEGCKSNIPCCALSRGRCGRCTQMHLLRESASDARMWRASGVNPAHMLRAFYVVRYSCDVTDAKLYLYRNKYCAMPALNVTLSLIGWFERASANGHRACIQVRSKRKSQFHKTVKFLQIHIIWHWNLLDMTTDVNSIMKVKEYRFHIPIYHIFWELQCAELPECIATGKMG
jgi:hypothetical protein